MANLQRWDPFAGLTSMHSQIDDMFNNFFGSNWLAPSEGAPTMDVYTEDDNKKLVAEIHAPGFDTNDIEITVRDNVLEIRGEKHQKVEDKDKNKRNYMMRESRASFYRSIALPKGADTEHVKAEFNDGVLRVDIPLAGQTQPQRIAIESSGKK